ncbi:hypothetical protein BJ964_009375 [Actinoplanes lobatus]|uniref:Uncharacterized protein n=1 Tax=Actinoplanes lobatus TaxID=113568 RepID=A0A7W7HRB7_9ACTN|nr:hypothetical protein [Actinoplanes lobatus]
MYIDINIPARLYRERAVPAGAGTARTCEAQQYVDCLLITL